MEQLSYNTSLTAVLLEQTTILRNCLFMTMRAESVVTLSIASKSSIICTSILNGHIQTKNIIHWFAESYGKAKGVQTNCTITYLTQCIRVSEDVFVILADMLRWIETTCIWDYSICCLGYLG